MKVRYSRSVKYRRKYRKLAVFVQLVTIVYALFITTSLLVTDTKAYYSSTARGNITITSAAYWWDGSVFQFPQTSTKNVKACAPIDISVEIKNVGSDMKTTHEFNVYYISEGNPKQNGELDGSGVIELIEAGQTGDLIYTAEKNGVYMFTVTQPEEYEGNYDPVIWSKKVHVNCDAAKDSIDEKITETEEQDDHKEDEIDINEEDVQKEETKGIDEEDSDSEHQEEHGSIGDGEEEKDKDNNQGDESNEGENDDEEGIGEDDSDDNEDTKESD